MERLSLDMKPLTKEIINAVSLETGIAPSYIEKDWYLVLVLSLLQQHNTNNQKIVFAGGTSLSKGYGLIHRFSEDVDFNIIGFEDKNRKARSSFRDELIGYIENNESLHIDKATLKSRDECKYINFYINYPKEVELESSLRSDLKVELSFKSTYLPTITKKISSLVAEFVPDCPIAEIECISPVETAANKFSALLWRMDIKDRSQPYNHMTNDPALMRHLHDLSALHYIIENNSDFMRLVREIFEKDKIRGDKNRNISLKDFINQTIEKLEKDTLYEKEYDSFVSTMCYGEQVISFKQALQSYKQLCSVF